MALSFIGKPISLISHSDVRYRGILAGIDPAASTIQLSKVYSMGTEARRPPQEFIPPVPDPYEYIIFRASEVKDLAVDQAMEPPRGRSVHDDPAVLGASSQLPPQHPLPPQQQQQQAQFPQQTTSQAPANQFTQQQPSAAAGNAAAARAQRLHTATASLETVERALGDLRVSQGQQSSATTTATGSRRRGGGNPGQFKVPTTDFDFETSNQRFVKAHNDSGTPSASSGEDEDEGNDDDDKGSKAKSKSSGAKSPKGSQAYDPSKSFFDLLTPGQGGGGSARPRGGGANGMNGAQHARARREEERVKNVATFGEPGRVGHGGMRPGGYVGGGISNIRGGRGGGGRGRGTRGMGGPGRGRRFDSRGPPNAAVVTTAGVDA